MQGTSAWLDDPALSERHHPPAQGNVESDFVVVGGGITGLSAAIHLRRLLPGARVTLLEKDRVGWGASGRSSGALTSVPDRSFASKLVTDGPAETRRAVAYQVAGVELARALISESGVDCELIHSGYLLCGREGERPAIEAEREAMRSVGVEGELLDRDGLAGRLRQDLYTVALAGPAFRVNPARYALALSQVAAREGVVVHEGTPVQPRGPRLHVPGGMIHAQVSVFAVDGDLADLPFIGQFVRREWTAAVATAPVDPAALGWSGREVLFEPSGGCTTYLTAGNRIVCRFGRWDSPPDLGAVARIGRITLAERFRGIDCEVSHAWSGLLGMTRTGYPLLASIDQPLRAVVSGGYNGHGLAYGTLGGRLVAEMLAGDTSPELAYAQAHSPA